MPKDVVGSVLVVGGGIAGMQSALDLANSGYYVYLLEKTPSTWASPASRCFRRSRSFQNSNLAFSNIYNTATQCPDLFCLNGRVDAFSPRLNISSRDGSPLPCSQASTGCLFHTAAS